MNVSEKTTVYDLVGAYAYLLDWLAAYDSHFENLKNPALFNTMARFATLKTAAEMAGRPLDTFLDDVRTEVAEEFAGEEAGLVRQVEDADALEVATLGSHVRSRKLAAAAGVVKAKSVRRGVRRCDLADASCFGVGALRETAGAPATPGGMDPACRTCANVPSVPVSSPPWRLP